MIGAIEWARDLGPVGLPALGVIAVASGLSSCLRAVVSVAGGVAFGLWAIPAIVLGATLGSSLAFVAARRFMRERLARVVRRRSSETSGLPRRRPRGGLEGRRSPPIGIADSWDGSELCRRDDRTAAAGILVRHPHRDCAAGDSFCVARHAGAVGAQRTRDGAGPAALLGVGVLTTVAAAPWSLGRPRLV